MTTSRRRDRKNYNEMIQMIVGCFSTLGFLSYMFPQLARGALGWLLFFGGGFMVILLVIMKIRSGKGIVTSVLTATIPAIVSFMLIYGILWYFMSHPELFHFSMKVSQIKK